ncbi:glycosyltransferase [Ferdinandcohnia sp. SAFN-114]|uniref:glycosyltransferase n=1 Tax=Ferdinandcohnia sp. SAFN-114 TaxID=3387275 RepID=UPI003F818E02
MRKKVCMFVWNHFTNDARVLRECTALSEYNYEVDLICIQDPKDPSLPKYEERNEHFKIYRVRRYPMALEFMQKGYRYLRKNKFIGLIIAALWLLCLYLFTLPTAIFTTLMAVVVLILKTKLNVILVRGSIIARMITQGYKKHYDIYHSNDLNTLPQGIVCSKFRLKPKKLIYDSHEVQTSRTGYSEKQGKLEGLLIKFIDAMIVENHTRAKYNEDLYGFYPNVVHNYPFKQEVTNEEKVPLHKMLGLPRDEKILLYQGGIQTGRGLERLIEAAPLFKEGTLVLIGDGRIKPKLQRMVEEKGLQDKVKFIPKVPLAELPKYTRNAYLGFQVLNNVCFNHYSASSNKLFEYMMAGVPVIACSFPEIQMVVKGEKIGLCVDSHNYESIAEGVNYLLEHPDEREKMIENTYTAKNNYNWENEKYSLLNLYNSL